MIEKSDLVCPWLPSTLVSDDGGRVTVTHWMPLPYKPEVICDG